MPICKQVCENRKWYQPILSTSRVITRLKRLRSDILIIGIPSTMLPLDAKVYMMNTVPHLCFLRTHRTLPFK